MMFRWWRWWKALTTQATCVRPTTLGLRDRHRTARAPQSHADRSADKPEAHVTSSPFDRGSKQVAPKRGPWLARPKDAEKLTPRGSEASAVLAGVLKDFGAI